MSRYAAGLLGGIIATMVLSALMVMKSAMGIMPQLDVIAMIGQMMGVSATIAWLIHFMIGAIWGLMFASVAHSVPGTKPWTKGALFSTLPWLVMMVALMPAAGAGVFGLRMGLAAPMMTLVLHLIFGAVMGLSFARLSAPKA